MRFTCLDYGGFEVGGFVLELRGRLIEGGLELSNPSVFYPGFIYNPDLIADSGELEKLKSCILAPDVSLSSLLAIDGGGFDLSAVFLLLATVFSSCAIRVYCLLMSSSAAILLLKTTVPSPSIRLSLLLIASLAAALLLATAISKS